MEKAAGTGTGPACGTEQQHDKLLIKSLIALSPRVTCSVSGHTNSLRSGLTLLIPAAGAERIENDARRSHKHIHTPTH